MLMHRGSLGRNVLLHSNSTSAVKIPCNHDRGLSTINSPHSSLYLSVRGCVHFETLLRHVSPRQEFRPDLCCRSRPGNVGLQLTNIRVWQLREEERAAVGMSPCPENLPSRWLHAWDSSLRAALSCFDFLSKTFCSTRQWQRKYFPVQK